MNIKQYRKKPVVIEAVQLTMQLAIDCLIDKEPAPFGLHMSGTYNPGRGTVQSFRVSVHTPEGTMIATPGDWIIKGVKGELYPCKPDIFEATYEPVEE